MEILIRGDQVYDLEHARLKELAQFILEQEGSPGDTELSIALVSGEEMAELNEKYLGRKGPTDVLSFFMGEQTEEAYILGDVIICPDEAMRRREQYEVEPGEEALLVMAHGILHLMGYDDEDEKANLEMDTRQRTLLKEWEELKR